VKPDVSRVLEVAAISLMADVAPNVTPSYRQASVFATAILLTSLREEFDRAAARRIEENRALRGLFADARDAVADAALRGRLDDAARAETASFLVSELENENAALRQLLIELHAHVERLSTPAARRVEDAIWRELSASTVRRKLSLGAF
jgi:hypothetical protein